MIPALMSAIYTRLIEADAGPTPNPLMAAVSNRIFALQAPASSDLPLVVYSIDAPDTSRFFGGNVRIEATVVVSVFNKLDAGPKAIADLDDKVDAQLDKKFVTVTGVGRGYIRNVQRGAPSIEGEYLRSDSTFIIEATN